MGYIGKIFNPKYWKKGLRFIKEHGLKDGLKRFAKDKPGTVYEKPGEKRILSWQGDYDSWTKKYFPDMKKELKIAISRGQTLPSVEMITGEDNLEELNRLSFNAKSDFISFPEKGSVFDETFMNALMVSAAGNPDAVIVYTDEDCVDDKGVFHDPLLKPDFSPHYLNSMNYIGRAFAVRLEKFKEAGGFDLSFSDDIDEAFHDLLIRLSKEGKCGHFPGVFYHAPYKKKKSERIRAVRSEIKGEPLISVVIPNKDHTEDLDKCIRSFEERSTYQNLEYIIVENNSTEEKTFSYYEKLKKENNKVRVIFHEGGFNYPKINNEGEACANGEYILLLNNDIELKKPDSIYDMLRLAAEKDAGAVGARLYYPDGTVQHAGVAVGLGGVAAHSFSGFANEDEGYMSRIVCTQDLSAVTAACMLVKKSVYDEVGGLTEDLAVAFNDIDFCLKIREKGYRVIYDPDAELIHYESKSRGAEDTPEKVERFNGEIDYFKKRWADFLKKGDPFYNPYLTLDTTDFTLKA